MTPEERRSIQREEYEYDRFCGAFAPEGQHPDDEPDDEYGEDE